MKLFFRKIDIVVLVYMIDNGPRRTKIKFVDTHTKFHRNHFISFGDVNGQTVPPDYAFILYTSLKESTANSAKHVRTHHDNLNLKVQQPCYFYTKKTHGSRF